MTSARVVFADAWDGKTPIGGKARALAEAQAAGLPVPEWFVVASGEMPDAGELDRALERLDPAPGAIFAVRSSAAQEDSAHVSFAGQLESYLHVKREEVAAKIAAVRDSAFAARLQSYRLSMGVDDRPDPPAVIVQRMVSGECSGVAFSADPVSARRSLAVVAAVPGLASALVSGETPADTWHVDRANRIVARLIEHKDVKHLDSPEGVRTVAIPEAQALQPAIDDALVVSVAKLARRAERLFGRPQDIEWTLAGKRLYLLQSRAITTLASRPDPDGVPALWDNSNIVESYGGITTPLTFSFARRAYESVYREFCRLLRVPEDTIERQAPMFRSMLGLMRGRVYYNLYNWYRLVAVVPGYATNRRFMEQMMGVRESIPEDVAAAHGSLGTGERVRDALRLCRSLAALAWHLATLPRRVRRFELRIAAALATPSIAIEDLRLEELVAHYGEVERRLLLHWDAPIVNDFATMLAHGLLRRACAAWLADEGNLHNDLLCAEPGIVSEEPARWVERMGALAARDPALVSTLCDGNVVAIRAALVRSPDLQAGLERYLERFGDRCMEELKLESPTLRDEPMPLYRAVGSHAAIVATGTRAVTHGNAALREAAEARVKAALARRPLRRLAFRWILARARNCVRTRENLRFERTRVFGRARRIVVEMGKRLAALERLQDARDVFYLEIDELVAFIEARATTTDLAGLVAVRKAEFAAHREAPAPAERFETRGLAYAGHDFAPRSAAAKAVGPALRGLACCPGIVRGPVHVVRDARSANVRRGEILVAERTDPGWVMLFPAAAGLLVERGSLLSHSAIVARELGLPTIVSLPGLTGWLEDGEWVEMNGATGDVVKMETKNGPTDTPAR